jgi:hypothetical protein
MAQYRTDIDNRYNALIGQYQTVADQQRKQIEAARLAGFGVLKDTGADFRKQAGAINSQIGQSGSQAQSQYAQILAGLRNDFAANGVNAGALDQRALLGNQAIGDSAREQQTLGKRLNQVFGGQLASRRGELATQSAGFQQVLANSLAERKFVTEQQRAAELAELAAAIAEMSRGGGGRGGRGVGGGSGDGYTQTSGTEWDKETESEINYLSDIRSVLLNDARDARGNSVARHIAGKLNSGAWSTGRALQYARDQRVGGRSKNQTSTRLMLESLETYRKIQQNLALKGIKVTRNRGSSLSEKSKRTNR